MRLRRKALLIIISVLSTLVTTQLVFSYQILLKSYLELEESNTNHCVQQVINAINKELDEMSSIVDDWARWNDTYHFVEDGNQEYIDNNLTPDTFIVLKLNTILYINTSSTLVYGKAYDLSNMEEMKIPESFTNYTKKGSILLNNPTTKDRTVGILHLPSGLMLVAAQPTSMNDYSGPSTGTLIIGRLIDFRAIKLLEDMTNLEIDLSDIDNPQMPLDFIEAKSALSGNGSFFTKTFGSKIVSGYSFLKDIYGKPAAILKVSTPRDIYMSGESTISFFAFSVSITGVVGGIVTLLLIEYEVLRPFGKFGADIASIGKRGDLSSRVKISGNDERSEVAKTVNLMLGQLEESEKKVLQSERLAAIGQTATLAAHDLRNPLQVLVNMNYTAKQQAEHLTPQNKEEVRRIIEILDKMLSQINYMDKIVSDLHFYSTDIKSNPVPTNLSSLVKEILGILDIPNHVKVSVSEDNVGTVKIDPTFTRRILINLITNSIQAMPKGGQLGIKISESAGSTTIMVKDTGEGIAKENLEKIFIPHFTTKSKGQGLGLKVCKRLVEAQNGTLEVESQLGKGSTFTVRIPTEKVFYQI